MQYTFFNPFLAKCLDFYIGNDTKLSASGAQREQAITAFRTKHLLTSTK